MPKVIGLSMNSVFMSVSLWTRPYLTYIYQSANVVNFVEPVSINQAKTQIGRICLMLQYIRLQKQIVSESISLEIRGKKNVIGRWRTKGKYRRAEREREMERVMEREKERERERDVYMYVFDTFP